METQKTIIKETVFLILIIIASLYALALISYSKLENPFSGDMIIHKSNNYLGIVGAYLADFSLAIFGISSYIIALTIALIGVNIRFKRLQSLNYWFIIIKLLLFCILIITSSALFNNLSDFSGGWLGEQINNSLKPLFGSGIVIMYIAVIMINISIITNISWINVLNNIVKIIKILVSYIYNSINFVWSKLVILTKKIKYNKQQKILIKKQNKPIFRIKEKQLPITTNIRKTNQLTTNITNQLLPNVNLLDDIKDINDSYSEDELQNMSKQVIEKLNDFGFQVEINTITPGPVVTQFELSLAPGIKVSQIMNLDKDLARALLVQSVRIVDVIPGKPVIGLEIPNSKRKLISLKEIIIAEEFISSKAPLTMSIGQNINGENIIIDLAKSPHLLVAGATGMGKSVGLNAMILGILFKSSPQDVRIIMIDPKVVELAIYADIPHLLTPVVTDMNKAASALYWSVGEMERRYLLLASLGVRNIDGFNQKIKEAKANNEPILDPSFTDTTEDIPELEAMPLIVIVIDEYADMLGALAQEDRTKSKRTEALIIRLAQKARAAGIHLIIATQRPSVDVITGLIKSNIPSRIAFKVASKIDSRTILDNGGAEQLLGMGDMLYTTPGQSHLVRIHGAFVSDAEITRVVSFLKKNYQNNYIDDIVKRELVKENGSRVNNNDGEVDSLYDEAVKIVVSSRRASISSVQRRLRIGYNRAARIIEDMEAAGVVSAMNSAGNREVLITE